jgi:hypothetical protein
MSVSNTAFETAYKNLDNRKLMDFAVKKYNVFGIPADELEQCKRIALWKTLLKQGSAYKFTTRLVYNVKWECSAWITKNKDTAITGTTVRRSYTENHSDRISAVDELNALPEDLRSFVSDRYLSGLKLREVAEKHGCSIEWARQQILEGISILKTRNLAV